MKKKAQGAMIFIYTYGWAILIVLAAVGVLGYMGVLNPANYMPSKCISQGFTCSDFHIEAGTPGKVTLYLANNMGFMTDDVTISLKNSNGVECCSSGFCATNQTIPNGEQLNLNTGVDFTNCNLVSGEKFAGRILITYTNVKTGATHTTKGDVTGGVP